LCELVGGEEQSWTVGGRREWGTVDAGNMRGFAWTQQATKMMSRIRKKLVQAHTTNTRYIKVEGKDPSKKGRRRYEGESKKFSKLG